MLFKNTCTWHHDDVGLVLGQWPSLLENKYHNCCESDSNFEHKSCPVDLIDYVVQPHWHCSWIPGLQKLYY